MTAISAEQPLEAANSILHPIDMLMHLVVTILAPMFLIDADGNIHFARMAAMQTVHAYRARNNADLLAVAQIIGFGLAALGTLGLSMADNLSMSMVLRLRGCANALNRSAEQNRRALRQHQTSSSAELLAAFPGEMDGRQAETPTTTDTPPKMRQAPPAQARDAQPVGPQPQAAVPAQSLSDRERQAQWGAAMADVAAEMTADLDELPPEERRLASLQAAALRTTADALLSGAPLPFDPRPFPPAAAGSPARRHTPSPGDRPFPPPSSNPRSKST